MTRINGQQARQLLDRVQPVGNWDLLIRDGEAVPVVVDRDQGYKVAESSDCDIAAMIVRAPDLAETITWLYGADGEDSEHRWRRWPLGRTWSVGLRDGYISIGPDGGGIGFWDLDAAENAARALLAAIEEARNGHMA